MRLKIGSRAPEFVADSTSGEDFKLSSRKGKWTVLFFYPKDFTYGCTREACTFRDEFEAFMDLSIDVFGISKDSLRTHLNFKKELNLPYDLLVDKDLKISKKYEAIVPVIGISKRITFLIDPDLKIAGIYDSLTRFDKHVMKILKMKV